MEWTGMNIALIVVGLLSTVWFGILIWCYWRWQTTYKRITKIDNDTFTWGKTMIRVENHGFETGDKIDSLKGR